MRLYVISLLLLSANVARVWADLDPGGLSHESERSASAPCLWDTGPSAVRSTGLAQEARATAPIAIGDREARTGLFTRLS